MKEFDRWEFNKLKVSSRVRTASVSLLAAFALVLTGCTADADTDDPDEVSSLTGSAVTAIDDAVVNAMQWSRSTEAVVGVWTPSGDYVSGFATDSDRELGANTLFRGAQTTQPMLCALLLDIAAEGLVTLEREVAEDLPRQTGIEGITYRQLCDGTSGLPDFKAPYNSQFVANPTRHWPSGEFIAEALIRDELSWPGLDVHRSDSNAVLLGTALSVVTGESLRDLFDERIFEPAEMFSSYYPSMNELTLQGDDQLTGTAYLHGPQCEGGPIEMTEVSPSILGSAGATVSTVNDLRHFYEAYLGGMFGGEQLAQVVTETKPNNNPERDENGNPTEELDEEGMQRGFGINQTGPLWGYNGSMPGAASAAFHDPTSGFTVVVVLNNSSVGATFARNFATQIASIVQAETGAIEVPWTAESRAERLSEAAICQDEDEGDEE